MAQENISQDSIELLHECDKGIQMGLSAMHQVADKISDDQFRSVLEKSRNTHENLKDKIQSLLQKYRQESDAPNPLLSGMSYLSTNLKIALDAEDTTIADLLTDGCDMGIKSLRKYLNEYERAGDEIKDLCRKIISAEEELRNQLKAFL